jgi:mRNA interferase RelE/StbE
MPPSAGPAYRLTLSNAAFRDMDALEAEVRRQISSEIEQLRENPRPYGVLRLAGSDRLYRIRAGPAKRFRVIYQVFDRDFVVLVVRVADRKEAYRGL